jgi:hypothetical protein
MSRYFFHIRDGWAVIPDEEGMDFPNLNAARVEAYSSACDLCEAASHGNRNNAAFAIEIADRDGNVLGSVAVLASLH